MATDEPLVEKAKKPPMDEVGKLNRADLTSNVVAPPAKRGPSRKVLAVIVGAALMVVLR